jgi:hypothetical protein
LYASEVVEAWRPARTRQALATPRQTGVSKYDLLHRALRAASCRNSDARKVRQSGTTAT